MNSPIPFDQWPSAKKIEHCLRGYSIDVEFWSPDIAETAALTLPRREDLHALRGGAVLGRRGGSCAVASC